MEAVRYGQIQNLLITIPPGCTKSILVGVMFPAWSWIDDPSLRWLCAANEGDLATRDSLACRYVVQSDWYKRHYPGVEIVSDQNVKTWYQTSARGHRQAITVASKTTGKKGDILLLDDPNDANKVEGEADRKLVIGWWKDAFFDRVNDFKLGKRVVVGQRTHRGDLQGFIKEAGGFEELCIPEEFETSRRSYTSIGWTDWRTKEGELLRENRFGNAEVIDAKKRLGSIGYNAKHQQRPESKEGYRFRATWLEGTWHNEPGNFVLNQPGHPEYRFPMRKVRQRFGTADGAASAKTGADYTVVSSWLITPRNDMLWLGCRRVQAEIPDQPAIVEVEYIKHGLSWIGIEAVLSNVALFQYSKRTSMNVRRLDPGGIDKLARATPAVVFAEAGRLFLPSVAHNAAPDFPRDAVIAEMLAFTGDDKVDEHDDIVDTFAYAVKSINAGFVGGHASRPQGVATLPTDSPTLTKAAPKIVTATRGVGIRPGMARPSKLKRIS